MIRLKLHGTYNRIIRYAYKEGEPYIDCYDDSAVQEVNTPYSIALMIEPRSIMPDAYRFIESGGWKKFAIVFTHDSELLKLPNAKYMSCGAVWSWAKPKQKKTKGISIISSWKEMCPLHKARKQLAIEYDKSDKVDCFGSFRGDRKAWTSTEEAHAAYKFAIVIENYKDSLYFTEKILNCFANKTVPIYYGADELYWFFDSNGVIAVDNVEDIPRIVDNLNIDEEYAVRKNAIEHNYELVKTFEFWEEQFMRVHRKRLEDLQNEKIKHSNSGI